MTRYRLDLGYDGAAFHGWAGQAGLRLRTHNRRSSVLTDHAHDPHGQRGRAKTVVNIDHRHPGCTAVEHGQ